jgi:hypothetical protein
MAKPREIAATHFDAALEEARRAGVEPDTIARYMLTRVVETYLATRGVDDVRREILTLADNIDPDTDYMFMRP